MIKEQHIERIGFVLFSLCVSLFYLLVNGYSFNSGDLSEHLPQVYKHFQPELYPGDFFISHYLSQFTVREVWVKLVIGLSYILPVSTVCFTLLLVCITLTVLAWMNITRQFTSHPFAPHVAALFIFIVFNKITVGGNTLMGNAFYSSIAAEAFASWAIYFLLNNRIVLSALLCALALWFQAVVGLQMALLLGVVVFSQRSVKDMMMFLAMFFMAASPVLIPLLKTYLLNTGQHDKQQYYKVLYEYRAFLHYLPLLFPLKHYLLLVILCLPALAIALKRYETFGPLMTFSMGIILFCVLYTLLIYTFWPGVGMLQAFKTTTWLNAVACTILAIFICDKWLSKFEIPMLHDAYYLAFSASIMLLVLLQSADLPWQKLRSRYQIGNYEKTDLQHMHEWIKINTPVDALCITDPSDDSFSCEAQRSMPVNYKAVVHDANYMLQWWERMKTYYSVSDEKAKNILPVEQAIDKYNHQFIPAIAEQCDYALFRRTVNDELLSKYGDVVHNTEEWKLIQIKKD
jgi:hypothetical protein